MEIRNVIADMKWLSRCKPWDMSYKKKMQVWLYEQYTYVLNYFRYSNNFWVLFTNRTRILISTELYILALIQIRKESTRER